MSYLRPGKLGSPAMNRSRSTQSEAYIFFPLDSARITLLDSAPRERRLSQYERRVCNQLNNWNQTHGIFPPAYMAFVASLYGVFAVYFKLGLIHGKGS